MLILSRKKNERIKIGGNVSMCIVDIRGDKVRLGFDAPKEVSVHRQEVADAIERHHGRQPTPHPQPDAHRTTRPLPPAREPLSAARLSEICQMDLEGCDESRASDYFEAMHDLLCELRLMDERLKQWNQAATEFPGGPAKPGRLM